VEPLAIEPAPADVDDWGTVVPGQRKGTAQVKRIKGNVIYSALWLIGIISFVLASGAPNKWSP
jgi:hypothetical protein